MIKNLLHGGNAASIPGYYFLSFEFFTSHSTLVFVTFVLVLTIKFNATDHSQCQWWLWSINTSEATWPLVDSFRWRNLYVSIHLLNFVHSPMNKFKPLLVFDHLGDDSLSEFMRLTKKNSWRLQPAHNFGHLRALCWRFLWIFVAFSCCCCHWIRWTASSNGCVSLLNTCIITHIKVCINVAGILAITQLLHSAFQYQFFYLCDDYLSIHLCWMRVRVSDTFRMKFSRNRTRIKQCVCIMVEPMCHSIRVFQIMNVKTDTTALCHLKIIWFSVYRGIIQCVRSLAHIFFSFAFSKRRDQQTIIDHHHR